MTVSQFQIHVPDDILADLRARLRGTLFTSASDSVADLELARELLGFPDDRDWVFLISLGYPADRPLSPIKNPKRRAFDDVVHRGRW